MERLGVLGGSFDPPHFGHLILAQAALRQLELDRVLWVPAGQPPHKHGQTAAEQRVAMTLCMIENEPAFELCRLDVDRPGPHYTFELLALLNAREGANTWLWFLVGQDSLRDLGTWYEPERILELARLAVYPRNDATIDWADLRALSPNIDRCIDWLDGPPIDVSSRFLRRQLAGGLDVSQWVPDSVLQYIDAHNLYRPN